MKKYNLIYLFALLLISACQTEEVKKAFAEAGAGATNLNVHESVEFLFTGTADQVVVYTGDQNHNYELRDEYNTGFVINKNKFRYSYKQPGNYKVVFIASCYGEIASNLNTDTCSIILNVVDYNVDIDKISCPQILYDEVFATQIGEDWFMKLPQKITYNGRDVAVSSSQKLDIELGSDSAIVTINDNTYIASTKYKLNEPLILKVLSSSGISKDYMLYTSFYPEFTDFKLSGYNAIIVRNEYSYNKLKLQITVPAATDVSNVTPTFTTATSSDKVYINGEEQISGTSRVDFTQSVTYNIVSEVDGRPDLKIETNFEVEIIFQTK